MRIEFSEHAEQQLNDIFDFLSLKNESAAVRIYNDILDQIEKLLSFPQMAAIEPILEEEPEIYRSLVANRQYKVIYYVEAESIHIVDIWDCRRDPDQMKESIKK